MVDSRSPREPSRKGSNGRWLHFPCWTVALKSHQHGSLSIAVPVLPDGSAMRPQVLDLLTGQIQVLHPFLKT